VFTVDVADPVKGASYCSACVSGDPRKVDEDIITATSDVKQTTSGVGPSSRCLAAIYSTSGYRETQCCRRALPLAAPIKTPTTSPRA
jgi:hypothetical protein